MSDFVIFACSPRQGGNTDLAAQVVAQKIDTRGGACRQIQLRDYRILPCTGCGTCETTEECVLGEKDQVRELFSLLQDSRCTVFLAPIYFYHVPAQFKAFIDRAQVFYWARRKELSKPLQQTKQAWLGLWGGRNQGRNLFCGAERSVRLFLRVFGFELQPPLVFYGVDRVGDILKSADRVARLENFGNQVWQSQD